MEVVENLAQAGIRKRVFPSWSIEIPPSFAEAFVSEGGYWHSFGEDRSVSLTSLEVTDRGRPVPARSILRQMTPSEGNPVDVLPKGLVGWAVNADAGPSARASRCLTGMLATDGHVLLATITSDDADWALSIWRSIRSETMAVV